MLLATLFVSITILVCTAQENNVCKTTKDYSTLKTNPNCWYNYIVNATVPEIIMKSGRPFKEYKITTNDGYILTIFRIPNTDSIMKKQYPIFLQHGMVTSSANWVSLGEDSLAFQLSNSGYDVWLGNYRGSQYSEEHVNLTVHDDKFWDYNVDDVALIDIPATLQLIATETNLGGNIVYVGHSLGTTLGLIYASEFPDEAARSLHFMVLAGPVYKLANMKSPIPRFAVNFSDIVMDLIQRYGLTKIVSYGPITNGLSKRICNTAELIKSCVTSLDFLYGENNGIEADKYLLMLDQHLTGTSIKLIKQVTDFVKNEFRKYDYGLKGNLEVYGQPTPPNYNISKSKVPTLVIYAKNDWHSTEIDVMNLYNDLSKDARFGLHEITEDNFNHMDFNFGKHTKRVFVDYIIKVFENLPNI